MMETLPPNKGLGDILKRTQERADARANDQRVAAERLAMRAELIKEIGTVDPQNFLTEFHGDHFGSGELVLICEENYTIAITNRGEYSFCPKIAGTFVFEFTLSDGSKSELILEA